MDVASEGYAKEDSTTRLRMRCFSKETVEIYKTLRAAGVKNLRPILDTNNFELYAKGLSKTKNEEETVEMGWF